MSLRISILSWIAAVARLAGSASVPGALDTEAPHIAFQQSLFRREDAADADDSAISAIAAHQGLHATRAGSAALVVEHSGMKQHEVQQRQQHMQPQLKPQSQRPRRRQHRAAGQFEEELWHQQRTKARAAAARAPSHGHLEGFGPGPAIALGQLEELGFSNVLNASSETTTTLPYQGPAGVKGPPGPAGDTHVKIHLGITQKKLGIEVLICALAVLAYAKCVDSYIIKGIGQQATTGGDGHGGRGKNIGAAGDGGAYGDYGQGIWYDDHGVADGGGGGGGGPSIPGSWVQQEHAGGWNAANIQAESEPASQPFAMPTGEEAEKRASQASQLPRKSEAGRKSTREDGEGDDDRGKKKKKKKKDEGWFFGLF